MSDAVDKRALRAIERRERGEAKRAERRARYQGQTNVASPNDRCCCCSAVIARIGVNVLFAVRACRGPNVPTAVRRFWRAASAVKRCGIHALAVRHT